MSTGGSEGSEATAGRPPEPVRELTPALVTRAGGRNEPVEERDLPGGPPGLRGRVVHHTSSGGPKPRRSTVVLIPLPQSQAYVPALACRDRAELRGAPAELPAERWEPTELESIAFNRRYRLLSLRGQSAGWVRELFSPRLVDWLTEDAPRGLSFEINQGHLAVLAGEHLEGEELEKLGGVAGDLARRILKEVEEEVGHTDVFRETEEERDLERATASVRWPDPPASVPEAISAYRKAAMRRPRALAKALIWAIVIGAAVGAATALAAGEGPALAAGAAVAALSFPLALILAGSRYRWGTISVSRAALEAFARGYARSRDLGVENRWRFHATHRDLALPGFADHVLVGRLPGTGLRGRFLMLADDAELRSRGTEVVLLPERPWASNALLLDREELERNGPSTVGVEVAEDDAGEYRIEEAGPQVLVWRPLPGNLVRTTKGSDLFCARAAALAVRAVRG